MGLEKNRVHRVPGPRATLEETLVKTFTHDLGKDRGLIFYNDALPVRVA